MLGRNDKWSINHIDNAGETDRQTDGHHSDAFRLPLWTWSAQQPSQKNKPIFNGIDCCT